MVESCSVLMDELDKVEKDIKIAVFHIRQGEREFIEQEKELTKRKDEIIRILNVCQKDWHSI